MSSTTTLLIGITKALLIFMFRLLLIIPMIFVGVLGLALSGDGRVAGKTIVSVIEQPFKAVSEAIHNIVYEIRLFKENRAIEKKEEQ